MAAVSTDASTNAQDRRKVVLLKSLATNNRFYALVDPDSGLRNAATVEQFPEDMHLGVAYPCLEDGLNDFAVIRTTFETLEFFPNDPAMKEELMAIIEEARDKLVLRLTELRDRLANRTAHFLGTDLGEFRAYALEMVRRGYPRRNLDNMMKLNVFMSVEQSDVGDTTSEPLYFYTFRNPTVAEHAEAMSARDFVVAMLDDVLDAVKDEGSYESRYVFDRDVFQKFIAIMFINYATTDPVFYGTHMADYGVSADRDMDNTPLYRAIGRQLREIEAHYKEAVLGKEEAAAAVPAREPAVQLPEAVANEEALLGPLASICSAARRLERLSHPEATELARAVMANVSIIVEQLRGRGLISAAAYDPSANHIKISTRMGHEGK
jgi:hypothetical protein